ncbi:diacylglycerol/lipid kinase family protein [Algoriphagus vanfongensis]|uniref:diacylglycerol/lipid kinase family protein n=1 Tax=Algoriphagus vanfongensis TaxID=426371 RepID=UPI000412BB44|nr:diacylglycerol kinase family protein [Algoriphagus vanfongensis]
MKMKIILFYNPSAGDEDFPLEKVTTSLEMQGACVISQNIKEAGFEKALNLIFDLIIIAGGDGTVETILPALRTTDIPIVILPWGTANNIAGSLSTTSEYKSLVKNFKQQNFQKLTIGKYEYSNKEGLFIEGIGWGLFTELLLQKARNDKNLDESFSKVDFGINNLIKLPDEIAENEYKIELDGKDKSGKYLWVEILNIKRLGPKLILAPDADHSDLYLDVMLVDKSQKAELRKYLQDQKKERFPSPFKTVKAKIIKIQSSQPFHVDDTLHNYKELKGVTHQIKISLTQLRLKILKN